MGAGQFVADNQDVTHTSGGSRLCNSIIVAVCVAPLLIIGMCLMLGWNEQRAVCTSKAIIAGKREVHFMGCTNPKEKNGALVMMNCDIKQDDLPTFTGEGDFSSLRFKGTGLKVKAEMYQCVESKHSETHKDKGGGGGKTSITTYTYSTEWKEQPIDSASFQKRFSANYIQHCGHDNPAWPSGVPRTKTTYAESVQVGAVKTRLTSSIPLDTPVSAVNVPSGWTGGPSNYNSNKWRVSNNGIGDVRVTFLGNDWDHPAATLLGKNINGEITAWTAPASWLCSGSTLENLKMGSLSKDQLFEALQNENATLTWILRFVGFAILWLGFSLFFGPLEVMADCIPCVGPFLGNSIEAVACCVSCLPATACCSLIVGIVWVAMRPMVGVPLMLFFCLVMASFFVFRVQSQKRQALVTSPAGPAYGSTAAQMGVAVPVAAVPVQPSRQFQVQVPVGCGPGSVVQVTSPEGTLMHVTVPEGCYETHVFAAAY